eukprot:5300180-Alexandrium_andersonii.AAC.1
MRQLRPDAPSLKDRHACGRVNYARQELGLRVASFLKALAVQQGTLVKLWCEELVDGSDGAGPKVDLSLIHI